MLQSFRLAIKSIWSNKVRSFLTMLGIIIGVASVIILVSLVNGYMGYMTSQFASLGTNQITVRLTNLSSRYATVDQMYEFYEQHRDVYSQMTPNITVSASVKHSGDSMDSTTVTGVSEEYIDMVDRDLEAGRFLTYSDIVSRQKVCVLGYYPAVQLFGSANKAVGDTVLINGYAYNVVGVAERQTSASEKLEDGGTDDYLFIPYSVAVKLSRTGIPNSYTFATVNTEPETTKAATTLLEDFLYTIYKNDGLYRVSAMSTMLDRLNSMIAQMSLLLGGIAGISLLVAASVS